MKRRPRTIFTPEQKAALEAAYSGGGIKSSEEIDKLSLELQLSPSVIKVSWIGKLLRSDSLLGP